MARLPKAGYTQHDGTTDWQECDSCALRIGDGLNTEYDEQYHTSGDPSQCPRCEGGLMCLPDPDDARGEYVHVMNESSWGDTDASVAEHEAGVERMDTFASEHAPDGITVVVRTAREGEIAGTYREGSNGDLQILGASIPVPDEIAHLTEQAWHHALKAWPATEATV